MTTALAKHQGVLTLLDEPLYQGSGISPDVPDKFHVALAGRPFLIDRTFSEFGTAHKDKSIELLRPQADSSQEPSESGINPDATWIRSQHSWHHGAGQALFDRPQSDVATASDRERFSTSKGIDVWTEGQISLLADTQQKFNSTYPNNMVTMAGPYILMTHAENDGTNVAIIQPDPDIAGSIFGTGYPTGQELFGGRTVTSLTSDGFDVWAVCGTDGIYTEDIVNFASTQYISDDCTGGVIGYVKARLMLGLGASLYNITGAGTLPSALFTQANSDFVWVGFAEGTSQIYAGGYSGHKSLIYRIQVTSDGLTLDQPIVAGELPEGERLYSIFGYLGFMFLGTSKGVRYCTPAANGDLVIGDTIDTPNPVECFTGWDRWVYFGLTNYDGASTGIGRMDLRTLADEGAQQLAYATDILYAGQGRVTGIAVGFGWPYFAVDNVGLVGVAFGVHQYPMLCTSGQVTTGTLDYGMVPDKVTTSIDLRFGEVSGYTGNTAGTQPVAVEILADHGAYDMIGYEAQARNKGVNAETRQARGSNFQLRFTLTRSSNSSLTSPTLVGWTLNAEPTASYRETLLWPLVLANWITDETGGDHGRDPQDDLDFIKSLHAARTVFTAQIGAKNYRCVVTDYDFRRGSPNRDGSWNGTCITYLKRVAS